MIGASLVTKRSCVRSRSVVGYNSPTRLAPDIWVYQVGCLYVHLSDEILKAVGPFYLVSMVFSII